MAHSRACPPIRVRSPPRCRTCRIDTAPGHRRRGHAAAAFRALAAHMAGTGRQPVWGAQDDNVASLALAARLGFEPVDRLALLRPAPRSGRR